MGKKSSVPYLSILRSHIGILPELHKKLDDVINSGVVVLGPSLSSFENDFAKFSEVKYCAGVANGLDALIISLMALGVEKGDEVIVPSNTYIATLISVSRVGAHPVLVEPNIETYNIDIEKIEQVITKKTKVIIPVHLYGQVSEMEEVMRLAKKYNLYVVEDNAQSHGSTYKGKQAGSFGDINATSFYPGKNLGALGDGGAIITDSKKYYDKALVIRNYGFSEKNFSTVKGLNSRLDELQAAFLSVKLRNLNEKNNKRKNIAKRYIEELNGIGDLILPKTANDASHVYHAFVIRTSKRDELQLHLRINGIGTMIHYPVPPHLQKSYMELGYNKGDYPIAEGLAKTGLSIPIFPEMTDIEHEYVIKTIRKFFS